MSQTYYFKLPMYLDPELHSTPNDIKVEFDGVEIEALTITSMDKNNPHIVTFSVDKEPGFYTLAVTALKYMPDEVPEVIPEWSRLIVEDIWVSIDDTNWKSLTVNHTPSDKSDDLNYGFNPFKGAYFQEAPETISWNVALVNAAEWDARYLSYSEMFADRTDEELMVKYENDAEMVAKYKEAKTLLAARGYN